MRNRETILTTIRCFNTDLFGMFSSEEQFHPDRQENGLSGDEVIISISPWEVGYEITADQETFETELENLTDDDLDQIINILENRLKIDGYMAVEIESLSPRIVKS